MADVEQQYVPLHLHTEYSLLDGAIRIKELLEFCKENNFPAVAVTDHGVMYGDMELYELAMNSGVKPIMGCEFYVHDGDITEHDKNNNPCYHLVLLAKNNTGYANIIKLTSIAWCEGKYVKPRINWELIEKHHEGLICCSACLGGEVLQRLQEGKYEEAKAVAKKYKDLFGEDYYIELQDHGLEEQKRTNPDLIKLAQELDIEMVITNDSHYLRLEDADMHDTLLCMQTNSDKDDPNRFHFPNNEFYVKTPSQLRDSFRWMDSDLFDRCIKNTVKVAEKSQKSSVQTQPGAAKQSINQEQKLSNNTNVVAPPVKKISSDPTKKLPKINARSSSKFSWPVRGKILSNYGAKSSGLFNDGINIGATRGSAVKAAENGVVAYAGNEVKGMGNLIIVQHEDGWMTVYAHMDSMNVRRGVRVSVGQQIGTVGKTGKVDSPQLHFEIRKGTKAYNPTTYLKK